MKYLIAIYLNPKTWEGLPEEVRDEMIGGIDEFMATIRKSGEFVGTHALGDPAQSAVVRVRDGAPVVTDGPFVEAKEHLAGFYVVDVESRERALEIAAAVPDARVNAMEVRPIVFSAGPDD